VVDGCGVRGFSVLIRGSSIDEVILVGFLCVVARFFCGFLLSGYVHALSDPVGLDANDMATRGQRIFCSLQGAGSVDCGCLVRFVFHLLVTSWWSLIPLEGSLHVDWGWPAERPASDPGEHEVWPGRSAVIRHAFGMLLMAVKLEDSSSTRVSAVSFVLDYFLHCGRWRSSRLWQRRSTAATGAGCFCKGLMCNFSFIQECPVRGLVVKVLYQ
jgi:hypothetical protein